MRQYQVAYGNGYWRRFNGNVNGLIQTGTEADGTPLYSCRVHYYSGSTGPSFPNAYTPDGNMPNMPNVPTPPDMTPPDMTPPGINPPSMPNVPNFPNLHMFNISMSSPMGISTADYGSDLGYQPGKIVNGNCNFPLGGREIVQPPPFQALYPGDFLLRGRRKGCVFSVGPENPLGHLQMHRGSYISTGILSGIDAIALSFCSRRSSQRAPMRLPAHQ